MYAVPLGLVAGGLLFAALSLPFMGVDLLIDAVGFLLVFNGANGLKKLGIPAKPAPLVALFLVVVAAVQLFATGLLYPVLAALRAALECTLYILLVRGLKRAQLAPRLGALLCALGCAGALLLFLLAFLPGAAHSGAAGISLALRCCLALWFLAAALRKNDPGA